MINNLKPLAPYEIRDIEREIEERLNGLRILESLVIVKSFKKGKYYGIGFNRDGDLILRNFVRVMGALFRPKPAAGANADVTLYDITNASKNVRIYYAANYPFNQAGLGGSLLAFGNPASPPTVARDDYELASKVAEITPSSTVTDETNWRVIVTGSYVWAAGGIVREAGQYGYWSDSVGTWFRFLLYHDALSDVVVPAGGTVSVTYKTQL